MDPKFKQMVLEMALNGREKAKWEPWAKFLVSFFEAYPDKSFDEFCFFVGININAGGLFIVMKPLIVF